MPHKNLNDIDIHYRAGGSGPCVLFTHGFSATGDMWNPQRSVFEERYRFVTWDLRGHGRTDSPSDPVAYSHDLCVSDLAALLDSLEIDRAIIGGLSLGGFLSLDFYRQHPDRVSALVICDAGPGYRNPEARAQWNENAERRARDFEERGLDALSNSSREMREAIAQHLSAQGLAHAARGMLAQFNDNVINTLSSIEVPTLVVVGANDKPFVVPCEYMAKKIPGARLEVIPDAGHAANLDPEESARVLLRTERKTQARFARPLGDSTTLCGP